MIEQILNDFNKAKKDHNKYINKIKTFINNNTELLKTINYEDYDVEYKHDNYKLVFYRAYNKYLKLYDKLYIDFLSWGTDWNLTDDDDIKSVVWLDKREAPTEEIKKLISKFNNIRDINDKF